MTIVAIDAGTSTIKAVAFDRNGDEIFVSRREINVDRPNVGWSEQDMNLVWTLVGDVARETAQAVGNVEAVAITAQGDGCWLVDSDGEPVRAAMLWNDGRAAQYVEQWRNNGALSRVYARNGSVPFSGMMSALLRWLADHEPASLTRSAYALSCGSWIFSKLTGEVCAEPSDAFVPFVDAATGSYSEELLALYGVAPSKRLLPPIGTAARALSAEAAHRFGLKAGLPVVLAPYDVPSAALGVGACNPDDAIVVLGTTFLCGVVRDLPRIDRDPAGCLVPLGLPSRYLRFHATLAGMEVAHWAARMLGLSDARDLIALAADAAPGANGICFLPYLSPAGERAPFLDPSARGSFLNLSLAHDRRDIARAVIEGLCMVVRDCFEAIGDNPSVIRLSGGGTSSAVLCQLLADGLGRPVQRAAASELTCRGAALYAALALGDTAAQITWQPATAQTWQPDPHRATLYAKQFADFRRFRPRGAGAWRRDGAEGCDS